MRRSHRHKLLLLVEGIRKAQYALRLNGSDQSLTPVVFAPKSGVLKFECVGSRDSDSTTDVIACGTDWFVFAEWNGHSFANSLRFAYVDGDGGHNYMTTTLTVPAGKFDLSVSIDNTSLEFTATLNGVTDVKPLAKSVRTLDLIEFGVNAASLGSTGMHLHGQFHRAKMTDPTGLQGGEFTKGDGIDFHAKMSTFTPSGDFEIEGDLRVSATAAQRTLLSGDDGVAASYFVVDLYDTHIFRFWARSNGVVSPILASGPLTVGQSYAFKVTVKGGVAYLYLDESLIGSAAWSLNGTEILSLLFSRNGSLFFDDVLTNVRIRDLTKPVSFGPELFTDDPIVGSSWAKTSPNTYENTGANWGSWLDLLPEISISHAGKRYMVEIFVSGNVSNTRINNGSGDNVPLVVGLNQIAVTIASELRAAANTGGIVEIRSVREITEFEYREYLTKNSVEDQGNGTAIGIQTGNVPRFGDNLDISGVVVGSSWMSNEDGSYVLDGSLGSARLRYNIAATGLVRVQGVATGLNGAVLLGDNASHRISQEGPFEFFLYSDDVAFYREFSSSDGVIRVTSITETTDLYFPNFDAETNLVELPWIDSHYDFSQKGKGEYGEIIRNKIGSDG
ncbi:MAG: hypothetical protein ACRBBW_16355, partial [Cellvibrionaceae bacterium]